MIHLPGGWEWILIIVLIIVLFGGSRAIDSMKKAGREVYKLKKEVDDIKDISKK